MIIAKGVPLGAQIRFMAANVRTRPSDEHLIGLCRDELVAHGLVAFRALLRTILNDPAPLYGRNDDAKHDELIATLGLLYACFVAGDVVATGSTPSLVVEKALLLQQYRKGGIGRRLEWLARFGFTSVWWSRDGETTSQRNAAILRITVPDDRCLLPAVERFVSAIEATGADPRISPGVQYACIKQHLFVKADYETAFTASRLSRDEFDPRREDVLATAGRYEEDWLGLVDTLAGELRMISSGFFYYEAGPAWVVRFSEPGSSSFLIVNLGYESLRAELTLPLDGSDQAVRNRHTYSPGIRTRMEALDCTDCDPECHGRRLSVMDGVKLCRKNACNRRIYLTLSSRDDFTSIESMARSVFS